MESYQINVTKVIFLGISELFSKDRRKFQIPV